MNGTPESPHSLDVSHLGHCVFGGLAHSLNMNTNRPITFADLRHYLAHHVDSPTEISRRLQAAADRLAATVAILERTEARLLTSKDSA